MPGRVLQDTPQAAELFNPLGVTPDSAFSKAWEPRFNVGPGQKVAAIRGAKTERMLWGMSSRGGWRGAQPFARSEGIIEGTTRVAARCIIPITGWYEWVGDRSVKRVYCLRPINGVPLALAGICADEPEGPEFCVVTCEPNADIKPLHHRMGVFLGPADCAAWLDAAMPTEKLFGLLKPCSPGRFRHFEVSNYVSNAKHEGPKCLTPAKTGRELFR